MTVSRRRLLQAAALAAATAGCSSSSAHDAATTSGGPSSSTRPSGSRASPPAPSSGPPSSAPSAGVGTSAVEVAHGPRDVPAVALTFHGAGDRSIATAVLGELTRAGAHVTVLAVGTWLLEQPDMARLVLDGGHELGNHTLHHRPMRGLAAGTAYDEIVGCRDILRRQTGVVGPWFRASGIQVTTPTIRRAAARAGYRRALSYDVDSRDYTDPGSAAVVRNVLATVTNGSVVSLHLGHRGTIAAMPPLLAALSARGLRPVTASELLA